MRASARRLFVLAVGATIVGAISGACSGPSESTFVPLAPDEKQFTLVALLLDHRCGTLDCHGSQNRNLKLYGEEGLRLSSNDVPGGFDMTPAEMNADYWSVVDLEPEVMSAVVADHGASPERLSIVRKARGMEKHAGGARFTIGDEQDRCLLSWLAGAVDEGICGEALVLY